LASAAAGIPGATNLDLARYVVDLAVRAGAEQCDVVLSAYDETEVTVRRGATDRLIEAGSRALGLRVIDRGRTAVCSTSDLDPAALERLARETVELARISAADEHAGLPDPALLTVTGASGLQLFDENLESLGTEEKIRMATACEEAAFAADPRISNSDGASVSTRSGEFALANSLGFAGAYSATSVSLMVEVMADDAEGKKRNAYWYSVERHLHRLADPAEVGRIAARRAIDQLGARKVPTRQVPVVFEPLTAVQLLGELAACCTGSALYRGTTFLAGRQGERIGSSLLSIVDDPLVPGRRGSRPFDGEGVRSQRNELFREGVFNGFLFDSYSGRRTGHATTGSAARGVEGLPSPAPAALVLEPGSVAPGEIVADVQDGFYVTALMGHGFNPTTGDYSHGAAGFWIEGGRLAFPVTEVNISGRMADMLAAIDGVGDDLTWLGGSAAPTVRIASMTVSGL
jgi:PmbA protein